MLHKLLLVITLFALHLTFVETTPTGFTPLAQQTNFTAKDNTTSSTTSSAVPIFLRNGSLSTNSSLVCPGLVSDGDCSAFHYCFLPDGSTGTNITLTIASTNGTTSKTTTKCSTPISILTTLAVLNVLDAAFSLLMGHTYIRERIPKPSCLRSDPDSDRWTPAWGLINATLHIIPMMISAGISRSHNPGMTFASILGMWTMRPRGTFIVFLIVRSFAWHGFCNTIYDTVMTESLLDLFSLPFALHFLTGTHAETQSSCNLSGWFPNDDPVKLLHSSFGYATFAGVMSAIFIVYFLVLSLNGKIWKKELEEEEELDWDKVDHSHNYISRIVIRLCMEKKLIFPMIVTMGSFISNWVLWGSKYSASLFLSSVLT